LSAVVLTSENSADFYRQKLAPTAAEPAAAPEKPEGAKPGEPAVESSAEGAKTGEAEAEAIEQQDQHPDPEKRQKLNLRFSELSEKRKAAEAEAEKARAEAKAEREARELAERQAAELRQKYEPPKPDELGPKPTRAQFVNDDEFAAALEDWAGEKAVRERDRKEAQAKIEKQWNERQAAIKAELPDYDSVLQAGANLMVSNEVRDAILESEVGPGILYHLANNPEFVRALASKSRTAALREIGKLEVTQPWLKGKTAAPAPEAKAPAKPAAAATEISRAPAPITPLRGGTSVPEVPVDSSGNFFGDFATYKRMRAEGKIK